MTPEQVKGFIAKYQGAQNFVKQSHLEELSQLFEAHVEALVVRKDEFHDLKGSFMPRKETLDKFAQAAGVSFNATAETTRKDGDGCYIGTAQAMVMGPDGKWILGPICEYEFDCDVRLEEMKLNGKADWEHKDARGRPGTRDYTDKELAQERVQFRKVGRQRANTGARNRATLAVLGMQTGFKDLFGKDEPPTATKVFLFSRIIVNAKNELVLNRMLDNIAGPVGALYGNSPATKAIAAAPIEPAPYEDADDMPPMESAADQSTTTASLATQAMQGEPPAETQEDIEREGYLLTLEQYASSDETKANFRATLESLLKNGKTLPVATLKSWADRCMSGQLRNVS